MAETKLPIRERPPGRPGVGDDLNELEAATVATIKAGDRVLIHITEQDTPDDYLADMLQKLEEAFPGVFFRVLAATGSIIIQRTEGDDEHEHEWADLTQVADPARVHVCYCGEWRHDPGEESAEPCTCEACTQRRLEKLNAQDHS